MQGVHSKVFYYDCLPPQRADEPDTDFAPRKAAKERMFEMLRNINGWHVNEGVAKHRKRYGAQQKEVDILIAVDMLSHTHRRNMDRLTFIAGDQNFCPLIEAVVREGMYVELLYSPNSISKDLKNSADATKKLDLYMIHSMMTPEFRRHHTLPSHETQRDAGVRGGVIRATGRRGERPIAYLFEAWKRFKIVHVEATTPWGGEYTCLGGDCDDAEYLKRVHEELYGVLDWQAAEEN